MIWCIEKDVSVPFLNVHGSRPFMLKVDLIVKFIDGISSDVSFRSDVIISNIKTSDIISRSNK